MLQTEETENAPALHLSELNFGAYPMVTQLSRLDRRFSQDEAARGRARAATGQALDAAEAMDLGLVTTTPDELDWEDEVRIALEERASLSPDALTGMEANLRFGGVESMESRIFGRLSAWQNWIFTRPNAVGELGALKVYGTGNKARFNWERV
jgi:benzoyl-CoA-dihydrodiol lyase